MNFFKKESKSKMKKIFFCFWGGGWGWGAGVSEFFYYESKFKIIITNLGGEGVAMGRGVGLE